MARTDLGPIIAHAGAGVAAEAVDGVRSVGVGVDLGIHRLVGQDPAPPRARPRRPAAARRPDGGVLTWPCSPTATPGSRATTPASPHELAAFVVDIARRRAGLRPGRPGPRLPRLHDLRQRLHACGTRRSLSGRAAGGRGRSPTSPTRCPSAAGRPAWRLVGLKVVRADGQPCGRPPRRAARARHAAEHHAASGSAVILVLVRRDRRTIHDLIGGTAVVYSWDARWRPAARAGPTRHRRTGLTGSPNGDLDAPVSIRDRRAQKVRRCGRSGRVGRAAPGTGSARSSPAPTAGVLRSPPVWATLNTRSARRWPSEPAHPAQPGGDAVAEAVEEGEVDEHPHDPGREAAQADPAHAADGPVPTDGGDAAEVAVLERRGRRSRRSSRRTMALAACRPPCMATSQTPGRPFRLTMSPTAKTSGWPGIVRSGSTEMRPARSTSAPVASASALASGEACTPAAHSTVRAAMRSVLPSASADVDPVAVDAGDPGAHAQLDAEPLQLLGRAARQVVAERRQRLLAAVEQEHPHRRRVERAEVLARGCAWPARGSARPARTRSVRRRRRRSSATPRCSAASVAVSAISNAPSTRRRTSRASSMVFMPGRVQRQLVVAEVRLAGAAGDDQAVVGDLDRRVRAAARRARSRRSRSKPVTSTSSTRTLSAPAAGCWRSGGAIWPGDRMPVATWYSSGWKRWWLRRSRSVTSTGRLARNRQAGSPPKPPPTTTTRWRGAPSGGR